MDKKIGPNIVYTLVNQTKEKNLMITIQMRRMVKEFTLVKNGRFATSPYD
jgi:hypothetical protein